MIQDRQGWTRRQGRVVLGLRRHSTGLGRVDHAQIHGSTVSVIFRMSITACFPPGASGIAFSRKVIHVVRVLDDLLDYPEIEQRRRTDVRPCDLEIWRADAEHRDR